MEGHEMNPALANYYIDLAGRQHGVCRDFTEMLADDLRENRGRFAQRYVEEIAEHAAHAAEAMRRAVEEMK
jgi:hypothetical protein